jgi:hypothetical protein
MWKLDDNAIATFNQTAGVSSGSSHRVVSIDKIPITMRKHLIALN